MLNPQDILLLTASTGDTDEFAQVTSEVMSRYCQKYGYSFCMRRDGFRSDRPPAWSKPQFILEYLQCFEFVVWMDIDVLIMNDCVQLQDFIGGPDADWDILVAEEVFPHRRNINSGVMVFRNTLFSRHFLEAVENAPCDPNDRFYEQRAINSLMSHSRVADRVCRVHQRTFNSMLLNDTYRPGDFVLHFAGVDNRSSLMAECGERRKSEVGDDRDSHLGKLADGQLSIDSALNGFGARNDDIRFLQIGSHDGVTRDPLRRLAERNSWQGVCVEPVKEIFDRLVENSKYLPIKCINVAVACNNGTRKLARIRTNSRPLPMFYDQLGSLDRNVLLSHLVSIPQIDSLIVEESVDCVTPANLEALCEFQNVDVVHIDAEGMDVQILEATPLKRWETKVVIFEHKHCCIESVEKAVNRLHDEGFSVYIDGDDLIGIHDSVLQQCLRKWEVPATQSALRR